MGSAEASAEGEEELEGAKVAGAAEGGMELVAAEEAEEAAEA